MAATTYGVGDALTVNLWSKDLEAEALKKTYFGKFIGTSSDSLIQRKTETSKSAGDKVTFGLRTLATGDGVQGDGILEGNEESLTTYSDSLYINQLRHAHRTGGKMSEQRVLFNMRTECRDSLADWWANRLDTSFANQLCGMSNLTDTRYTGNNATVAPSQFVYGGNGTSESDIDSADIFSLTTIDKAVEKARTMSPMIRPVRVSGEEVYVAFLHDYQVTSLRTSTSTGQWLDIQKAALSGAGDTKSPIFDGSLGMYNGVILHRWNRIPTSATGTNVKRAVLCGAQAVSLGYGQDNGPNKFSWVEKEFDYGNQLGVSAGCIFGMKKTRFNSVDYGVVVMSTYAAAAV